MQRIVLSLAGVLASFPAVARAALDLQIGANKGADQVDAVVAPGSGEHYFDLTFSRTGTSNFNESIYAYDLLARAAPQGIRLVRIERPDNWIFTNFFATFQTPESASDHILVNAANGSGDQVHVMTGEKAARVVYTVDPGAAPGLYQITLDPFTTAFADSDPSCNMACRPDVDITDPGIVQVTPEPGGLAFVAATSVLALRRRRGR